MSLKSVAYVISSMTLLNLSATPGIGYTRISSRADVSAGCPCGGVFWTSMRRRGAELCLRNGCNSCPSPIFPGKSYCTIFTHCARVFPHKINSGNPITTLSVCSLHIIAAATKVKVFPRPISSATSAPGISPPQTHLLSLNHVAQTWCARALVPCGPAIEFLSPATLSSVDSQIGWGFGSLMASPTHSRSNSLWFVLRTVPNT